MRAPGDPLALRIHPPDAAVTPLEIEAEELFEFGLQLLVLAIGDEERALPARAGSLFVREREFLDGGRILAERWPSSSLSSSSSRPSS